MDYRERLEQAIAKDRMEYEQRKMKDENLWRNVKNIPPSDVPGYWKIYLATRSNGPCIYEYEGFKKNFWGTVQPNKLSEKLMYENEPGRNYYKVGDKILSGEQTENFIYRLFPELPRSGDEEGDWTKLLWLFLNDGEQQKYKFCWSIKSIEPDGRGGGCIDMAGIIYFDGYNVELTRTHRWNREQLNNNFVFASYDWTVLIWFIKATMTITMLALQGVGKSATAPAKALAKKILLKELKKRTSKEFRKKLFKMLLMKITKTMANSIKEFVVTFVKELKKGYSEQEFYNKISGQTANWKVVEPALREALVAFFGGLIDGLFEASIGEKISKNKELQDITKKLTEVALKSIMATPFNLVVKSVNSAYTKAQRQKKSMWDFYGDDFYENFKSTLEQIFLKDIPGAVTD
jgi:hypothetical protein